MYHVNIMLCDVFVSLYLSYGVACRAKNYKETEEKQEITIRNSKDNAPQNLRLRFFLMNHMFPYISLFFYRLFMCVNKRNVNGCR